MYNPTPLPARRRILGIAVAATSAAVLAAMITPAHASAAPLVQGASAPTATIGFAGAPAATPAGTTAAPGSQTFLDDFNGPAGSVPDAKTWAYQVGGNWGNGKESQYYTNKTSNAALTGHGSLLITAQGETYKGKDATRNYTSARLMTKQSVLYGTISARIRMTGAQGAWPAFWTMGANYSKVKWPACGELDVMEANNQYSVLYGSFHGPKAGPAYTAYNAGKGIAPAGGLGSDWHTYSATWTPTSISFALDGTTYATVNKSDLGVGNTWSMDNSQQIILNIAVGGMAGTPAAPSQFKATMEVDWVRVDNTTVK